ncbi:DNA-processing protein DprA [Streptomyces griseoaurantiacus]|uniref:DNA-processing protein DprA n=1 Tax=Streptomyces griseoaurantiacus TaxID=68213 RepID=UPI0030DE683C
MPPFLFYRGELDARDARSIAVVGTRQGSEDGLRRAARMAREFVEHDVVIASGLAKCIAAPIHPAENRPFPKAILSAGGALLSKFWPTSPPAKYTFPRRNVVTLAPRSAASSSRPPAPPARRCRHAWRPSTAGSSS